MDAGYSGSNFNRPGWKRMMEDINVKKINCILVKDFSRAGRNYLELGRYMESIFPVLQVRFISVLDQMDSFQSIRGDDLLEFHIKNLMNDFYAKDVSRKVKKQIEIRRKSGEYLGSVAPYGYQIARNNNQRILIPDEEIRPIIEEIYHVFLSTGSFIEVAKKLQSQKINPPQNYQRTKQIYEEKIGQEFTWNLHTIKRILTNPIYHLIVSDVEFHKVQKKIKAKSKIYRIEEG